MHPTPFHVLVVDDDDDICHLVSRTVKTAFPHARVSTVNNGLEGYDLFRHVGADVIISNYHMPFMSGPEMIAKLRAIGSKVPIISISGAPGASEAAFAAGANEFVDKQKLALIPAAIGRVLRQDPLDGLSAAENVAG